MSTSDPPSSSPIPSSSALPNLHGPLLRQPDPFAVRMAARLDFRPGPSQFAGAGTRRNLDGSSDQQVDAVHGAPESDASHPTDADEST